MLTVQCRHCDSLCRLNDDNFLFKITFTIVPTPPLNVRIQDITSTSVTVTWEPPQNSNGRLLGYQIGYASSNGFVLDVLNVNTWKLTGLNPFTKYTIFVRAKTAAGFSNYSNPVMITTQLDCKFVMCLMCIVW